MTSLEMFHTLSFPSQVHNNPRRTIFYYNVPVTVFIRVLEVFLVVSLVTVAARDVNFPEI